ncbi:putative GAF sensor signal transduction histidine kinase [Burkholderiales bacterium]|jgi:nitrate/nitrite-specific signal transduction histidine kinase|nr:putative GAF sensor signal transduction histidine kinase [Burkholderiales bacterium]
MLHVAPVFSIKGKVQMLQRCGSARPHEGSAEDAGAYTLAADMNAPIDHLLQVLAGMTEARAATVRTISDDGSPMDLVAASGASTSAQTRIARADADCGVCAVALRGDGVQVSTERCACVRELDADAGADHQVVAVALRHKEQALGVLSLFLERPGAALDLPARFPDLLSALGDVIGSAIANTRQADNDVHSSVMQERHMLANEVHDSLAQNLTSIRMRTALLRRAFATRDEERATQYLEEIDEALAGAQSRVREIITQFRAQMDAPRLLPALEFAIEELRAASEVKIELECRVPEPRLSPYEEVQIFYIAREALTNALKHSQARHVRLVLDEHAGWYELRVEDDGVGLDSAKTADHGHFGLNIMRERAQRIGGVIELQRCEKGGTRVRLNFPSRTLVGEAGG